MHLSTTVLGSSAVDALRKSAASPILQIGSDRFSRQDLAHVECFNFVAARILTKVLHEELQVKNLKQVYDEISPMALALPRLGVVSLAVLGAAFEVKGIGGDNPLENYVRKHAVKDKGGDPHLTTFNTIKAREKKDAAREAKARRARKASRRRAGELEAREAVN